MTDSGTSVKRGAPKVRVTEIPRWVEMYESGMTLEEVAEKVGHSKSTVYRLLRDRTTMRPRKPRPGVPIGMQARSEPVVCGRRICARCRCWRHVSDFPAHAGTSTGFGPWCRSCVRVWKRKRRQEDPAWVEGIREYRRIWDQTKRREQGVPERWDVSQRPLPRDPKHSHNGPDYLRRRLDLEPLLAELDAWSRQHNGNGTRLLAQRSGVSEKRVSDIVHRRTQQVSVPVADKLLVAMGLTLKLVYPDA